MTILRARTCKIYKIDPNWPFRPLLTSLSFLLGILHPEFNKNHHVSSNQAARSFLRGPKFQFWVKNHEKSLQRAQNRPFQLPNTKMYLSGTSLFRSNSITAFGDYFWQLLKPVSQFYTLYPKSDLLQLHKLVSAFPDRLSFIIFIRFLRFFVFLMSDLVEMSSFPAHLLKTPSKTAFFDHFRPIFGPKTFCRSCHL